MVRLAPLVDVLANAGRRRTRVGAGVVALVAVVAVSILLDLGRPAFWDPGESRYAETVREMVLSRNWIAPTLAFVRYYDKPPGFFWLVAGSFGAFGWSEWAARLPSAVPAVLTIALLVTFAWRRVGAQAALWSGVVLATAVQYVALARSVRMDMLLTLLVTVPLLFAFTIFERGADAEPSGRARSWPFYVPPAAGLLVKGPVAALLPLMVLAAFLVATRMRPRLERLRPDFPSLATLAALAAWYTIAAIRVPDYLWTFLVQHNLGRFLGHALAGHREPLLFYCWILPITFLPWTLFLPGALRYAVRRARRGARLATFLLAWCGVPFVFFSLSRAKLATYLLPIFPALALLVALYLDRIVRAPAAIRKHALVIPTIAWSVGMGAVALGLPIAIAVAFAGYRTTALPALALVVFPVLGWWIVRQARFDLAPVLFAVGALATQVLFFRVGAPVVDDFASLREAAEVARDLPASAPVFAYKTRGHSFTYYGGRSLLRVRSPADAADELARGRPTAVLVKKRHLEKIRRHLQAPVCIWWQSPSGRVLLANVPRPKTPGRPLLPAGTAPSDFGAPDC